MADIVNTGAAANDGSGDDLRTSFRLINERFQQLLGTLSQITWAPGLAIEATPARQWTIQSGQAYVATSNHIAGATFAADLAAGKWLAVDVAQLTIDLASDTGAGMVGFRQPGVGAVGRTLQEIGEQWGSVKDFGAKGDTVTDDTAAIAAAIAHGGPIYFPPGTYKVTTPLVISTSSVYLFGSDPAVTFINYSGPANTFCITIQRADWATAASEPFIVGGGIANFTFNLSADVSALRVYLVTRGVYKNLRVPNGINDNNGYNQTAFSFEGGVFNTIEDIYARGDRAPLVTKAKYLFKFTPAVWGVSNTSSLMTNCRIAGIYGSAAKIGTLCQTYSSIHELTMEGCEEYGVELVNGNWNALYSPWFEYNNIDIKLNTFVSNTVAGNTRIHDMFTIGYTTACVEAETGVLEIRGVRRFQQANYLPLIKPPTTSDANRILYVTVDNYPTTAKLAPDSFKADPLPFYQSSYATPDLASNAFVYKSIRVLSDDIREVQLIGPAVGTSGVKTLANGVGSTVHRLEQPADLLGLYFFTESGTTGKSYSSFSVEVNGVAIFSNAGSFADGVNWQSYPRRIQLAAGSKIVVKAAYPSDATEPLQCKMILGMKPRQSMSNV